MKNVAQREFTLNKVSDNNLRFFLTASVYMHLTHFHASYSPILLLLSRIVLNALLQSFS